MNEQENPHPDAGVIHHGPRESEFELALGDGAAIEAIGDHIEKHLGPIEMVFHEILSDLVHLDLHWVKPRAGRPFNTLVTSGMSDRPMTVPKQAQGFEFVELLINLPASWPMKQVDWENEQFYWPVRLLKTLARLPHEHHTWLFMGHTVGDPKGDPYHSTTRQNCALIAPCISAPRAFHTLEISAAKRIHFFTVIPLYPEEVELKLKHGANALFARLEAARIGDSIDPSRPNAAASPPATPWWRRWFRA